MNTSNTPLPVLPTPEIVDLDLAPLLTEPFAQAWAADRPPAALRDRLTARLQASRAADAGLTTTRRRRAAREALGAGVVAQTLYRAGTEPVRAGEPLRAVLIELAPGATLPAQAADALHREWLVLGGTLKLDDGSSGLALALRDYHGRPAGWPVPALTAGAHGALVFLRESPLHAQPGDAPTTVRDADADWPEFGPGIRRRVLWQRDGQASMLYHTEPGTTVPSHSHGHDEECLMLQGDLFLDDILLQAGDYQLAPAGSQHRLTQTDTGVVLYVHGDLDLRFD
jgi:quercetin dioxygenase-like cupin family protein